MGSNAHVWVVVLAAGEGTRVRDITHDRWGNCAPKQYSSLDGATTLLGATLARAMVNSPPERIVPIVAAKHQRWWAEELAEIHPGNVIVQPENRGTAAGILLPLLWITRHDPDALLVILPSDHGVAREEILCSAIADAVSCADCSQAGITLLGVKPEGPEPDYGWILPRQGESGRLRPVSSFREKPDAATSAALVSQGALLNSFILIANGRFLLELFQTTLPKLWASFQPVMNGRWDGTLENQEIAHLYRSVPVFDFSKDLLERVAEHLWVYPVPACGWLDLGTPERLTRRLIEQGQLSREGDGRPVTPRQDRGPHHVPRECPGLFEAVETAPGVTTGASA